MTAKFSLYDPAEALKSVEAIAIFMADAHKTGDVTHISAALGVVARAAALTRPRRQSEADVLANMPDVGKDSDFDVREG